MNQKQNHEVTWRINRFLARAGFGSRRSCEEHILKGRVSINGSFCRDLAMKVSLDDDVRVNGQKIHFAPTRTLLLHKPAGYVSTRSDRYAQKTIFDLLPLDASTLFHVGRLDKESEGLLLLTNDGAFAQELLHPSRGIDKEYEVTVDQAFTEKHAAALKKGTWIDGRVARVESVHQLSPYKIKLVLHQGIKRQIRVMLGQLGFEVKRLLRTRIGPLHLRGLSEGNYRDLRPQELEALTKAVASPKKKLSENAPKKKIVIARPQKSFTDRRSPGRPTNTTSRRPSKSNESKKERAPGGRGRASNKSVRKK